MVQSIKKPSFIKAFMQQPQMIGAVRPSSNRLAQAMVRASNIQQAQVVVELGGGTGEITAAILAALPAHAQCFVFETNPSFSAWLRARFADERLIIVDRSAAELGAVLHAAGHAHADCIFSGLPFQAFPRPLTHTILAATAASMHAHSTFLAFQYTQRQEATLRSIFASVELAQRVWRNIPPARIYRCRTAAAHTVGASNEQRSHH